MDRISKIAIVIVLGIAGIWTAVYAGASRNVIMWVMLITIGACALIGRKPSPPR